MGGCLIIYWEMKKDGEVGFWVGEGEACLAWERGGGGD